MIIVQDIIRFEIWRNSRLVYESRNNPIMSLDVFDRVNRKVSPDLYNIIDMLTEDAEELE